MTGRLDFGPLEVALMRIAESIEETRALAMAPVALGSRETEEGGALGENPKSLASNGRASTEQGGRPPSSLDG